MHSLANPVFTTLSLSKLTRCVLACPVKSYMFLCNVYILWCRLCMSSVQMDIHLVCTDLKTMHVYYIQVLL